MDWYEMERRIEAAQYRVADILAQKKTLANYQPLIEASTDLCRSLNTFRADGGMIEPFQVKDLCTSDDFGAIKGMVIELLAKVQMEPEDRQEMSDLLIRLRRTENFMAQLEESVTPPPRENGNDLMPYRRVS